jgi:6-pyruvoyltetrahydropterin/6-carboxytetrahydropterin synthase
MFEISASASFEASHYIEAEAGAAHYRRVHGHSFVVTASVAKPQPDAAGWVMDLGALESLLKSILAELDHAVLNDIPGLEKPTFENILLWIEGKMKVAGITPSRLEIERPTLRQRAVYVPGGFQR